MLIRFSERRGLQQRVLQVAIILAVLLAVAYLGGHSSPRLQLMTAGAVLLAALAALLLRYPAWGPVLLVASALVVPLAIGTGTQSSINVAIVMCAFLAGLWVLDAFVRRDRVSLPRSRTVPPLLALGLVTLLAFGAGQLGWFLQSAAPLRTQLGGLALFLLSIAAFLLVASQVRDERSLARMTWVFLALSSILVVAHLAPTSIPQPAAWSNARGSLFWTWLAALAFGQAVYNERLRPAWRVLLGLLAGSVFYVGLVRYPGWSAGWGPALAAVLVTLWAGKPRWGLAVTLLGAGLVALNWSRVDALLFSGGGEYGQAWSIYTRGEAWRTSLELVKSSPILGFGPANYYYYTPLLVLIRWNVNFVTHNQYLDLVLQTGVLGLACFLWFFWEAGRLAWRLRTRAPAGFARAYVYGALGGLAGTLAAGMLADWVIPFTYNIGLAGFRASVLAWLFLGGLVVLERTSRRADLNELDEAAS